MRGIAGHPADTDRDIGLQEGPQGVPGHQGRPERRRRRSPAGIRPTATQLINDFIASGDYDKIQGIWTSGMDSQIVDAIKAANKTFVPIVGADLGGSSTQLLDPTGYPGPRRRGRDQHRRRRRRRRHPGLKLLNGETVTTDPPAHARPNTVLLDPSSCDNTTDAGKADAARRGSPCPAGPALAARPRDRGWTDVHPEQVPSPARARASNPPSRRERGRRHPPASPLVIHLNGDR